MVIDQLRHALRYVGLDARIRTALDYLHSGDFARMDEGRYELAGPDLYAVVSRYSTKTWNDAIWESHRRYIDVQYVVEGVERMGYVPLDRAPAVKTPYDAARDVIFYEPGEDSFRFAAGQVAILWPDDIHAPGLAEDRQTPSNVLKVVMKVACH